MAGGPRRGIEALILCTLISIIFVIGFVRAIRRRVRIAEEQRKREELQKERRAIIANLVRLQRKSQALRRKHKIIKGQERPKNDT